ncbi:ralA-binding protein 1-like [Eriocheir sinensis]|uniref:ralA-binding protein 1-like n=1 Tax=Eriocheir sinensis TaxID=95602 RepID=UPI0021C8D5A1|nr:ralA-binding protein 1-like [Eriocheir sinensis]
MPQMLPATWLEWPCQALFRNPLKPKKQKSFKFLHKRKEEEKVERNIDKRKEKEERRKEEEEKKRFKKDKKKKEEEEMPVFGVPLCLAVQRCPAHDGIQLPTIVRECIDQIEGVAGASVDVGHDATL